MANTWPIIYIPPYCALDNDSHFLTMQKNISFGIWIFPWLTFPLNPQYASPFPDSEGWSQVDFFWNWCSRQEPCLLEIVSGITGIPENVSMAFSQLSLNMGPLSILLNIVPINGGWMLVENYLSFLPRVFPSVLQRGPSKTNKNVECCHHLAESVVILLLCLQGTCYSFILTQKFSQGLVLPVLSICPPALSVFRELLTTTKSFRVRLFL